MALVHGLGGHYEKTWGKFRRLLRSDPDLPRVSVLCWGYASGIRPFYAGVKSTATQLSTAIRLLQEIAEHDLFLVGHSLGGLVILKSLVDEVVQGRARQVPVMSVRAVTLYASPVMGNQYAAAIRHTVGSELLSHLPGVSHCAGWIVNRQFRDLASGGDFCNQLIGDVTNRIYRPEIHAGNEDHHRKITIQACVGSTDRVVTKTSVEGVFSDPPPHHLEGGHKSVKLPESHSDLRYLALKQVIAKGLKDSFHSRCNVILFSSTTEQNRALNEFLIDYRGAIQIRMRRVIPNFFRMTPQEQRDRLEEFVVLTCEISINMDYRPGRALDEAMFELIELLGTQWP